MADGDKEQETELELDLEAEQPDDQQAEPEGDEPESDQQEDQQETDQPAVAAKDQVAEPPPRPSRRDTRIQSLVESNRQREADNADLRRRLDELTRQVAQPRQQAESPEQRAARFALMTPQEQMQETLRESEQRWEARISGMQMQNAETSDRTAFQAKAAVDPLYAKWGPKVEGKLAEMRARGQNADREVLLKYLIGEAALERRSSKEGKREVVAAAQRVKRASTRPANAGSDTAATRRRDESLERRLENIQI